MMRLMRPEIKRKLRVAASLLIIIFGFLPLSQCSRDMVYDSNTGEVVEIPANQQSPAEVYIPFQVAQEKWGDDPLAATLLVLIFLLPALTAWFSTTRFKTQLIQDLIHLLVTSWLLYYSFLSLFLFNETLFFGYLFFALVSLLIGMDLFFIIFSIWQRFKR